MLEKVKEIIAENLSIDKDAITESSKIIADLGADSLDLVELVMSLEDTLGTTLPEEVVENFVTVGDVVTYLEENN